MYKNRMEAKGQSYTSPAAVVISAGGSPAAYDIVRSLGQKGIFTYVASSQENDIAYYSKYCAGKIPLYAFDSKTEVHNINSLLHFAKQRDEAPVLYYTSDPELSFLYRNKGELGRWFRFLLPSDLVLDSTFNKVLFGSFAKAYELPVPPTIMIKDPTKLSTLENTIQFPCIVKPAFSEDWNWDTDEQRELFGAYKNALRRIQSKEELLAFCSALPKRESGLLIQSYIEGRDEAIYSFHGYFDEHSKCLGYFLGHKIRTYPPHTGGSTYIQTVNNHPLILSSINLLEKIQFCGIVKIDYKWDSDAGEFKILEINPRYNLWEVLGTFAGVNLPYIAYCHQSGNKIPPPSHPKEHIRLLYLKQDIRALFSGYYKNGEWSILQYLGSLLQSTYFRIFDLHDIKPFLHSVYSFVLRNIKRLMPEKEKRVDRSLERRNDEQEKIISVSTVETYDDVLI